MLPSRARILGAGHLDRTSETSFSERASGSRERTCCTTWGGKRARGGERKEESFPCGHTRKGSREKRKGPRSLTSSLSLIQLPRFAVPLPAVMDPEILLGISLDNDLHLLIHFFCQTEDLRLLTLKGPGPEGVGDDSFEVIPILRSAAGDDHDRPLLRHQRTAGAGVVQALLPKKSTAIPCRML